MTDGRFESPEPAETPFSPDEPLNDDEGLAEEQSEASAGPLSIDTPVLLTVESRAHGWRVDHYLSRLFPNYSRGLFQKAITSGAVLINGLPAKVSRRLRVNDCVSVRLPELPDSSLVPEDIPLDILYEDDALVVINKPPGMIVHPGKGNYRGTLAGALQFHFDRLSDMAGKLRPGIVHRLDRDTSGVLVVAKDNQVHHRLSAQFAERDVHKEYRAIVRGEVAFDSDFIETCMRVHPVRREKMMVCGPGGNARHASTRFQVLERFRGFTWVRLVPRTGRTHQLRVHMQHIGHPIVADRLYGGRAELRRSEIETGDRRQETGGRGQEAGRMQQSLHDVPSSLPLRRSKEQTADRSQEAGDSKQQAAAGDDMLIARQALHAFRLEFDHPQSGQRLQFEAPLPADMQRTLEALRTGQE